MVWGIPRGFREGVLEEVEVGEDGKDEALAVARRTLAVGADGRAAPRSAPKP